MYIALVWRVLIAGVLLAVACGAGWLAAGGGRIDRVAVAGASHGTGATGSRVAAAIHILRRNLAVVGALCLGACTLGVLTVAIVLWNGFHLGVGMSLLSTSRPDVAYLAMAYVPMEFLAFSVAAGASLLLASRIRRVLCYGESPRLGVAAGATAVAVAMLVISAAIEAAVALEIARR